MPTRKNLLALNRREQARTCGITSWRGRAPAVARPPRCEKSARRRRWRRYQAVAKLPANSLTDDRCPSSGVIRRWLVPVKMCCHITVPYGSAAGGGAFEASPRSGCRRRWSGSASGGASILLFCSFVSCSRSSPVQRTVRGRRGRARCLNWRGRIARASGAGESPLHMTSAPAKTTRKRHPGAFCHAGLVKSPVFTLVEFHENRRAVRLPFRSGPPRMRNWSSFCIRSMYALCLIDAALSACFRI